MAKQQLNTKTNWFENAKNETKKKSCLEIPKRKQSDEETIASSKKRWKHMIFFWKKR